MDWSRCSERFSREPGHAASGLYQEQKDLEMGKLASGLERSDISQSREPDYAASGVHQEQKDLKGKRAL